MRKLLLTAFLGVLAVSVSAVPAKPGTKRLVKLNNGNTVGMFDAPKAAELFPDMKGWDMVALFPIGWPADDAHAG